MIDIIIIGAGTAGLSAAVYAQRAGFNTILLEKNMHGGQIVNTTEIENYPAIEKISGFDFVQALYNQATNLGAKIAFEQIQSFDLSGKIKKIITNKNEYECYAVIIANGCSHRKLECKGETEFSGKGVSYCATCDGAFFKQKNVAVVGGGNTAIQDAIYLAKTSNQVYLIHRRDEFRAEQSLVDIMKKYSNINILYNSVVDEIFGEQSVNGIKINNTTTGETTTLDVNGVFVAVGMDPDNELFKDVIEIDKDGYFISDENCTTKLDGVFVAGDTRQKQVRQLVTAASDGAISAVMASNYVNKLM